MSFFDFGQALSPDDAPCRYALVPHGHLPGGRGRFSSLDNHNQEHHATSGDLLRSPSDILSVCMRLEGGAGWMYEVEEIRTGNNGRRNQVGTYTSAFIVSSSHVIITDTRTHTCTYIYHIRLSQLIRFA